MKTQELVLVSNRIPVTISTVDGKLQGTSDAASEKLDV
jgi:hypothetical protein